MSQISLAAGAEAARAVPGQYEESFRFLRSLELIWAAIADVDGYLTAQKPVAADDPAQRASETVLYCAAQSLFW